MRALRRKSLSSAFLRATRRACFESTRFVASIARHSFRVPHECGLIDRFGIFLFSTLLKGVHVMASIGKKTVKSALLLAALSGGVACAAVASDVAASASKSGGTAKPQTTAPVTTEAPSRSTSPSKFSPTTKSTPTKKPVRTTVKPAKKVDPKAHRSHGKENRSGRVNRSNKTSPATNWRNGVDMPAPHSSSGTPRTLLA